MNPMNDIAIELKNVFEKYEIELTLDGKSTRESFEALHDISLTVKKGEGVAIMGPNGAGKSTLLRLIAGLLAPEKGEVKVNGRVGSLLDLGAGFHPELTGRDNLLLNASLYHFSREELDRKYEDILKFADVGKFINAPVRCYSQGMYVRLAFSLAIHVDPDIILIDDCLAVGDDNFRLKSVDKVLEMREKNTTIVLVTHDLDLAKKICSKGIYLKDSRIVLEGTLDEVAASYLKPVKVDKQLYQYLSAKISEEEKFRNQEEEERLKKAEELRNREEERQLRAEKERRKLEEEKQLIIAKTGEEQRKLEEEWLLKVEKERRRLEEEKRLKVVEERLKLEEEWQVKIEKERQRLEEEKQLILIKAGEQHRKLDEERELRAEQERQRIEEEKQQILIKAGEQHRKLAEEWQLKMEKELERLEEEKQLSLIKAGEQHRKLEEEWQLKAAKELQRLEEEKQLILENVGVDYKKLTEEWQLRMEQERERMEEEKQLSLIKAGEQHRKLEEEWQLKAAKELQKLEEEKQLILENTGQERRKLEEEWQSKLEEERRKMEAEKQLSLIKAGEEHRKLVAEIQLKAEQERLKVEEEKQLSLIHAGEHHRKMEEELQLKAEQERLKAEEEKQLILEKAGEERRKLEEEWQLKIKKERQRLEEEKQLHLIKAGEEHRKLVAEIQLKAEQERQRLEEEKQLILEAAGEEHRKLAEELQLKAGEERRKLEAEKQLILEKTGEEHRKLAEEWPLKMKEEHQRLEAEKQLSLMKAGEEHRKASEEWQVKMEEERQRHGAEKRLLAIEAEEARCKMEEEKRRRLEAEKQLDKMKVLRLEAEKQLGLMKAREIEAATHLKEEKRKQRQVLFCGPSLEFIISSTEVQIIHHDQELTSLYGIRTHFMIQGKNLSSENAAQRKVKKISDREVLCFLRWKDPEVLFQVWHFKSQSDGTVDFEITMRAPETLLIENEAVEYCLQTPCSALDEDRFRNKSTIFSCGQKGDFKIETFREDQICGMAGEGKDYFKPYFLTVSEHSSPKKTERRRTYFNGRFFSGTETALSKGPSLASHKIGSGRAKAEFHDGGCQLVWNKKHLTTGLGIYTSIYSNGFWYDSTQAMWKIKESSEDQLTVEGFWPWIPMAQTWKILLKDEKKLLLSVAMKVFQETAIHMQETVMMMSSEYDKWSADEKVKEFPKGFTSDDFFRFCLWANKADGVSSLASHSDHLPTVLFKPADMPGYRVIVENSQHIYGVQSRLFHCLRVNKKEESYFAPGEYEFFKGSIHLKEEKA
jgi:ABC-type polysaccharide/polyol phosphate transport system ATPase subunit